jgi:transcription initiation factor TFIIIB Brf1 subunit/transcription initiation factor TFIIB
LCKLFSFTKRNFFIVAIVLLHMNIISDIREACAKLNIPFIDEAMQLYHKFKEAGDTEGRPRKIMIAIIMYIIVRNHSLPITLKQISEALNVDANDVMTRAKALMMKHNITVRPPDVEVFIKKIVKELNLPNDIVDDALAIAKEFDKRSDAKKETIAGASVYLAVKKRGLRVSQREIGKIVGTTDQSMRKLIKKR